MDFNLTEEQRMIVETTRAFVENELYPHEAEVERTGELRRDLYEAMRQVAETSQGHRGGSVCGQHAGRSRRRRSQYPVLGIV